MPDLSPAAERDLAAVDDALAGRPVDPDLAVWAELTALLREERPRPSVRFADTLDARAAAGFAADRLPAGRRRSRLRALWPPALALATACLLVAVVVLAPGGPQRLGGPGGEGDTVADGGAAESAGGGSGGGAEPAAGAGDATARRADAQSGVDADAGGGSDSVASPPTAPPAVGSARSDGRRRRTVERSATLTLSARPRDIDLVSGRIQAVTRRHGGFVASASVVSGTPDGGGGGSFMLRVPVRNLDAAMAALARLGTVRDRSQSSQDITAAAVSAGERLQDARAERVALLRRLEGAVTVNETQSLRARLRIVSRQIAAARAARNRVANRGAFATVAVELVTEVDAEGGGAGTWTPRDAARDALRVLEVAAAVALLVLAVALPLALLAAPVALAMRWGTRRRRERALDAV
jgi:hypothetical protein